MNIQLDLNWHCNGQAVPKDLFELLKAIAELGSLRAAAEQCRLSYRHAWGLLQIWQEHFSAPLASLKRGRGKGANLTLLGEKLLWEYQRITARLDPELAGLASELSVELESLNHEGQQNSSLRIVASHGLVIANLRALARKNFDLNLDIQFKGSLESLQQYKKGGCDVAGFHLPEGQLARNVLPKLKRLINPDTDILLYAVRRQQGLMMAEGNPKHILGLQDLLQSGVQFINRQRQSGTRLSLDELLKLSGVKSEQIEGYDNEEFTHSAIAALVASGAADCGFGIEAAAAQFNLDFIPLNWESYWFVLPKERLQEPCFKAFISLLQSEAFISSVSGLKGYETQRSGRVLELDESLSALLF